MIQFRNALDMFILLMLTVTIILFIYTIFAMYMQKSKNKTSVSPKTITKIRCVQNDYNAERDFSKGDYVGLEVGKCPKCGSTLMVDAIYAIGGSKEKEPQL
ncbi:MAG: hypothetical protein QXZ63_01630 [Sulfolobales archaeon]